MFYNRRRYFKRYRPRHYKRRMNLGVKARINKLERRLNKRVTNYKYVYQPDTQLASSIVNATPFIQLLNGIPQGTSETNNRIGDLCRMHSLKLRMMLLRAVTTLQNTYTFRVLIVKEYTALGSAIGMSQLFNSATPSPRDTYNITTRNQKRFKIYFDKTYIMGPHVSSVATTALNNQANTDLRVININKKFRFVTDYSRNNNGNVSDIDTNSLYLIIITDSSVANDLQMFGSWTLSFTDS